MSQIRDRVRLWIGDPGESLPSLLLRDHRGMLFSKRASGAEDELSIGVADASDVMQLRRLLTKTLGDTLYLLLTGGTITGSLKVNRSYQDGSATGWTATAQAGMGTSPGTQTLTGGEYAGRIVQATGSSGAAQGALWRVNFVNNRASDKYTVLVEGGNRATNLAQVYVSNADIDGFTLSCANSPGNSTSLLVSWFIVDRVS